MEKFKTIEELAKYIRPETILELRSGIKLTVISCFTIERDFNFLALSSFNNKKCEYNLNTLYKKGELSDYIEGYENAYQPSKTFVNVKYNDCSRLFKLMDNADKSVQGFSKHLWHYAHVDNLIKIIKDGELIARGFNKNIPVDSYVEIANSKNIQDSNKSNVLRSYVRLNLRPLTGAYYETLCTAKYKYGNTVYISFNRDLIHKSNNATFLIVRNAHAITDSTLYPQFSLNKRCVSDGENNAISYFENNLNYVYSEYDSSEPAWLKAKQQAECLVYKSVPIEYIDKIYFSSNSVKEYFKKALEGHPNYDIIKDKIVGEEEKLHYDQSYPW